MQVVPATSSATTT